MNINPLIAKLESVAILSDDDRHALEAICGKPQSIGKGQDIVCEGDQPDQVHVVLQGWAARYKTMRNGSRQISALLIPGDLCDGEITVLARMDHSVLALTTVTIASLPRDALVALTRDRPKLAHAFWRATLVDLAVLRQWLASLGRRDAYGKVAHQICELHARLKTLGLATDGQFVLPLTQAEIGDVLGLTAVHINRVLKRLKDEKAALLHGQNLTIIDIERLKSAAGFDANYLHAVQT